MNMDGTHMGVCHECSVLLYACDTSAVLVLVTLGSVLSAVEQEITVQEDPAPTDAKCTPNRGEEEGEKGVFPLLIQHPMQRKAVHLYTQ